MFDLVNRGGDALVGNGSGETVPNRQGAGDRSDKQWKRRKLHSALLGTFMEHIRDSEVSHAWFVLRCQLFAMSRQGWNVGRRLPSGGITARRDKEA